jgi:hypothetical protein
MLYHKFYLCNNMPVVKFMFRSHENYQRGHVRTDFLIQQYYNFVNLQEVTDLE